MNTVTPETGSGNGGQCRDRTYDKLIKSHAPFSENQRLDAPKNVKPSLRDQYLSRFLSNLNAGVRQ